MQLVEPRQHRSLPIRLTPLIDVVFILLVFFMLTTRLLPAGQIDVDNTTSNQGQSMDHQPVVLTIVDRESLVWKDHRWTEETLLPALRESGADTVHLKTRPTTRLEAFTLWLTRLKQHELTVKWQRLSGGGNQP